MSQTSRLDQFAQAAPPAGQLQGTTALPMIVDAQSLAVLSRAELDAQMDAAGHRPRSLQLFRANLHDLVTTDEEVARECHYHLSRKKADGTESDIDGESIRFAEMSLYAFKNCRAGSRVIEIGATEVVAQGVFIDTEANVVTTSETRRRITGKGGRRYSDDMIIVTANAACSIAKRNAILQGIPKALWQAASSAARRKAAGVQVPIEERRARGLAALAKLGISEERVLHALDLVDVSSIDEDDLTKLYGSYTAIRDGVAQADEVFPKPVRERETNELDQFAQGNTQDLGKVSSGGEAPSVNAAAAGAGEPAPAPADPQLCRMCIDKILGTANDKKLLPDPEDRVATIDGAVREIWEKQSSLNPGRLPASLVAMALKEGIAVARGETKSSEALERLRQHLIEIAPAA